MRTKTSINDQLQAIIRDYRKTHDGDYEMENVARWAHHRGLLEPPRRDAIKLMTRMLSRAARAEYFTDPQGRRVRRHHPVKTTQIVDGEEKQLRLWNEFHEASPEHMQISLQQRRTGIFYDCKQHKTDADSYNDNNKHGAVLEFDYNFDEDLVEDQQPTEYPDAKPDDE